jgi:cytochrome c
MRIDKILIVFVLFLISFSCKNAPDTSIPRPIDHWVFRSVLDLKPRIITLALSDKVWAAYHTHTGALYKAWKGTVLFDGAVYTTAHGPQPISIGDAYVENKHENPWTLIKANGERLQTGFKYKGHRFFEGHVELMYELSAESLNQPVRVYEMVEAELSDAGQPVLERNFTTSDVPEGIAVLLQTNTSSIVAENNVITDGKIEIISKEEVAVEKITSLNMDFTILLNSNGKTTYHTTFLKNPTISNKNIAGGVDDELDENPGGIPQGLSLIAKSDCKTCHNKTRKTVGPSYVAIAEKYINNDANITLLSSKIKNGGSGIWGNQQMTPHPDLADEDITEMVKYILSLDDDKNAEVTSPAIQFDMSPDTSVKENSLISGSIVKVYDIPPSVKVMPNIKEGQKAKFAGVLPNFDNLSGNDFKELTGSFALTGEGLIKVDTAGTYLFHIWSDDGSLVYLGDKKILDNDSLHGTEYKEVALTLQKGYYPFRLEYFQGSGGKFLSFNWKKPGKEEFEVISPFNIFHQREMQSKLGNLTLPMAAVSKIPGDQYPLTEVHPSFDLAQARPDSFKPKVGGMDFLSDGRMVVSTWDEAGSVYVLNNVQSGDSTIMTAKRIAFGLAEPLGLKIVNDTIYVMQKQEMTRLIDTNKDDIVDEYQTLTSDWEVSANFHEFGFGLEYKDGFFMQHWRLP